MLKPTALTAIDPSSKIRTEMQQRAAHKVQECIERWNITNPNYEFTKPITLEFSLKGICAGRAWTTFAVINLNNYLLNRYPEDMIEDTVVHEVAHILANTKHKTDCKHDARWEKVCVLLGLTKPAQFHNYTCAPGRYTSKMTYTCGCGLTHTISHSMHVSIQNGRRRVCTKCGGELWRVKPKVSKLALLAKQEALFQELSGGDE